MSIESLGPTRSEEFVNQFMRGEVDSTLSDEERAEATNVDDVHIIPRGENPNTESTVEGNGDMLPGDNQIIGDLTNFENDEAPGDTTKPSIPVDLAKAAPKDQNRITTRARISPRSVVIKSAGPEAAYKD